MAKTDRITRITLTPEDITDAVLAWARVNGMRVDENSTVELNVTMPEHTHVWPLRALASSVSSLGATTITQCNGCCAVKVVIELSKPNTDPLVAVVSHPDDGGYK